MYIGGYNIRISSIKSLIVFLFFLPVLFSGVASALGVEYIISPDTLMLNSKAPYFAVEIDNSSLYYDVHDIDPDTVELSIMVKGNGNSDWFSLEPVKKNPEINEELNKLVLMYYKKELYDVVVDESTGMTASQYFRDLCEADGTCQVDFQVRGEFTDGSVFYGKPFAVDIMTNMRSEKGKSGKK